MNACKFSVEYEYCCCFVSIHCIDQTRQTHFQCHGETEQALFHTEVRVGVADILQRRVHCIAHASQESFPEVLHFARRAKAAGCVEDVRLYDEETDDFFGHFRKLV